MVIVFLIIILLNIQFLTITVFSNDLVAIRIMFKQYEKYGYKMNITIILILGSTIMLLKRVLRLLMIMPLRLTKTEKNQQKNKREAAVM